MYQISPGNNGNFDGLPPTGGDQVTNVDTTSLGVTDPEGINFDSDSGHLYIVGQPETLLAQVTTTGSLVRMVDISATNALKPAGLAYAPGLEETPLCNLSSEFIGEIIPSSRQGVHLHCTGASVEG